MVLIHGIGSALTIWDQMLPALEPHYDVLGVDLPGFGESPSPPAGQESPAELAAAVARELDAQGIERAQIVGNSLGGWVALELAMLGRAKDVVAISPAGMWTRREARWVDSSLSSNRRAAKAIAPIAPTLMRSAAGRLGFIQVVSRPWRVPPEEMATGAITMARATNFEATKRTMFSVQPTALDRIDCPVLIVWGTRDYLLFPRQGPRFERHIPGAELRPLPGLGHAPMLDAPDEIAELVLEFTSRAGSDAAKSAASKAPAAS